MNRFSECFRKDHSDSSVSSCRGQCSPGSNKWVEERLSMIPLVKSFDDEGIFVPMVSLVAFAGVDFVLWVGCANSVDLGLGAVGSALPRGANLLRHGRREALGFGLQGALLSRSSGEKRQLWGSYRVREVC